MAPTYVDTLYIVYVHRLLRIKILENSVGSFLINQKEISVISPLLCQSTTLLYSVI